MWHCFCSCSIIFMPFWECFYLKISKADKPLTNIIISRIFYHLVSLWWGSFPVKLGQFFYLIVISFLLIVLREKLVGQVMIFFYFYSFNYYFSCCTIFLPFFLCDWDFHSAESFRLGSSRIFELWKHWETIRNIWKGLYGNKKSLFENSSDDPNENI